MPPTHRAHAAHAAAALTLLAAAGTANAIISVNANPVIGDAVDINLLLGADRFYDQGYTGSRSVIANIEAGHAWNGHETLSHVTTLLNAPPNGTELGSFDFHATAVAQAIGGRGTERHQQGIAHGAELWSGAVATGWATEDGMGNPIEWSGSFFISLESFTDPFVRSMRTGVNGRTADVINLSWGDGSTTGTSSYLATAVDALANETGKLVVTSAGNAGPASGTAVGFGAAFNTLSVAALGADTDTNPYDNVSWFSSRGPNPYADPNTGNIIRNARATVDVAAPGQNLLLSLYGGFSGGHRDIPGATDPTGGANNTYSEWAGTSFSSPIVAGGAGLITDVGRHRFGTDEAVDGRVLKAVIMNSASKTNGWDNGQTITNNTIRTTQAVDWAVGTGRMDLNKAFDQYTAGTTDILGTGGGIVEPIGWDFGQVSWTSPTDYYIDELIPRGYYLTATLTWFTDSTWLADGTGQDLFLDSFDDLDLQVWEIINGTPETLIAESVSDYNTAEHLHFRLPHEGRFMLRVLLDEEHYDFNGDLDLEQFGIAWAVDVPAPATTALLTLLGLGAARRRRDA